MSSPADYRYSQTHEWHKVEGTTLTLGITRYAVDALTDVTYVQMKGVGTKIAAGSIVGEVESVKTTSDIYCAAEGEVIEVNKAVAEDPSKLNTDPYSNWLVKLKITGQGKMGELMDAAAYDKAHPAH
jgi:glycine cleavage system H protein